MNKSRKALLIVDVQPTFCDEGQLPVEGGNLVAKSIADLLKGNIDYDLIISTQDWHIDPGGHFSENPDYLDSWPVHGLADTPEADLHPEIESIKEKIDISVKKGMYEASYSGFEGVDEEGNSLNEILAKAKISEIDMVGLAFDYCVKATALDAVKNGYKTTVIKSLTAPVSIETAETASTELDKAGVEII
jgi:nicotinamidase/pyrazinamidase